MVYAAAPVRPLSLKLKGLRSYREEQLIDFSDASLVAIVGDTGAGKSSLLEAITVALYGSCTWAGGQIKPLISDGAQQLSVEMTFRAEDKTWRVLRSTSRSSYPPSVHRLECLDDGSRIDGERAVQERIRQVVGLDYEAFLRAVVLPQGRFAMLLQATDAQRTSILKGILRLDRLEQVREEARGAIERLQPVLEALRVRRAALLVDPSAAATDAQARLAAAGVAGRRLTTALEVIGEARALARAAAERRDVLEALGRRARDAEDSGAAARLRELEDRAEKIEAEVARLTEQIASRLGEEEELAQQAAEADHNGLGLAALARARADVETLRMEGPLLARDAAEQERVEATLIQDAKKLEEAAQGLRALERSEDELRRARDAREAEARAKAEVVERGRRLLAETRKAAGEEARAAAKLAKANEALVSREAEVATADAAAKKATAKRTEAAAALDAAQQRSAARHAAMGARAGDPCPVCERPLPSGFQAPRAPALDAAHKKLDEAAKAQQTALALLAKTESRVEAAREAGKEAAEEQRGRRAQAERARAALVAALPGDGDDDARLAQAQAQADATTAALGEAREAAGQAHDATTRANASVDGDKKRLKERRDAAKKAKDSLATRRARLADALARLPEAFRPKLQERIEDSEAALLLGRIDARRARLEQVQKELAGARAARSTMEGRLAALGKQRRVEVEGPAHEIELGLGAAAERLSQLADALEREAPPSRPERASPAEAAAWAEELAAYARGSLARCDEAVSSARREVARAGEAARRALAEAGVESEAALGAALVDAQAAGRAAEQDLARAEREAPIAADLDGRVVQAAALVTSLSEVRGLLSDGRLLQYVVSKKQRTLLGVASELLSSVTRGRFGFSEDFDVVDRLTGQARGPRTLSGGETFLASLSLALGLVELAGRSGGRLEALFLDEGFGALDAGSLSDALNALTRVADRGRLVAVISHVRSVAESIDRVLLVKLGPEGSHAEWVTAPERDEMLAEEARRRLLG